VKQCHLRVEEGQGGPKYSRGSWGEKGKRRQKTEHIGPGATGDLAKVVPVDLQNIFGNSHYITSTLQIPPHPPFFCRPLEAP
jgi:hypothetical protein